jgi:hypothetical protein
MILSLHLQANRTLTPRRPKQRRTVSIRRDACQWFVPPDEQGRTAPMPFVARGMES